jgi:Mrp family chromosome partitioning ATPase
MAASDAAIVARVVDGIMLVVQPEKNHRRLVLRAVESLLAFRVNLIGVIANRITDTKQGYYEYSYGYGYGYGTHYGHEEQVDEPQEAAELAEEDSVASATHPVQPEPDRFREDLFPATRAAADGTNQINASRPRRVA